MNITEEIALMWHDEVVELPKFKDSLDRLLNKRAYNFILTTHSIEAEDLSQFVGKATDEGNAVLIQREHNGYMVTLWKD